MSKVSYTNKMPSASQTPVIGGYCDRGTKTQAPAAAKFNQGASHIAEIKHATEQRRAHSAALSDPGRAGWKPQSPLS
jgi:hypothetical protein